MKHYDLTSPVEPRAQLVALIFISLFLVVGVLISFFSVLLYARGEVSIGQPILAVVSTGCAAVLVRRSYRHWRRPRRGSRSQVARLLGLSAAVCGALYVWFVYEMWIGGAALSEYVQLTAVMAPVILALAVAADRSTKGNRGAT